MQGGIVLEGSVKNGECSRCGSCCRWMAIGTVKEVRKVAKDFLSARGAVFKDGLILIPFVCPHLKTGEESEIDWEAMYACGGYTRTFLSTCDIHDHKPAICREFKGQKTVRGFPTYVPDCCTMKVE